MNGTEEKIALDQREELRKLMRSAQSDAEADSNFHILGKEVGMSEEERDQILTQRLIDRMVISQTDTDTMAQFEQAHGEAATSTLVTADLLRAIRDARGKKESVRTIVRIAPSDEFAQNFYKLLDAESLGITEEQLRADLSQRRAYQQNRSLTETVLAAKTSREAKKILAQSSLAAPEREALLVQRQERSRATALDRMFRAPDESHATKIARESGMIDDMEIPSILERRNEFQKTLAFDRQKARLTEKIIAARSDREAQAQFDAAKTKNESLTQKDREAMLEVRKTLQKRRQTELVGKMAAEPSEDGARALFENAEKKDPLLAGAQIKKFLRERTTLLEQLAEQKTKKEEDTKKKEAPAEADEKKQTLIDALTHALSRKKALLAYENACKRLKTALTPAERDAALEERQTIALDAYKKLLLELENEASIRELNTFVALIDPTLSLNEAGLGDLFEQQIRAASSAALKRITETQGYQETVREVRAARQDPKVKLDAAQIAELVIERTDQARDALRTSIDKAKNDATAKKIYALAKGKRHSISEEEFTALMSTRKERNDQERVAKDEAKELKRAEREIQLNAEVDEKRKEVQIEKYQRYFEAYRRFWEEVARVKKEKEEPEVSAPEGPRPENMVAKTELTQEEQYRVDFTNEYVTYLLEPLEKSKDEFEETIRLLGTRPHLIQKNIDALSEQIEPLLLVLEAERPDLALAEAVQKGHIATTPQELQEAFQRWYGKRAFDQIMSNARKQLAQRRTSEAEEKQTALQTMADFIMGKRRSGKRREAKDTRGAAGFLRSHHAPVATEAENIEDTAQNKLLELARTLIADTGTRERHIMQLPRNQRDFVRRALEYYDLIEKENTIIREIENVWGTNEKIGLADTLSTWLQDATLRRARNEPVLLPPDIFRAIQELSYLNQSLEQLEF